MASITWHQIEQKLKTEARLDFATNERGRNVGERVTGDFSGGVVTDLETTPLIVQIISISKEN